MDKNFAKKWEEVKQGRESREYNGIIRVKLGMKRLENYRTSLVTKGYNIVFLNVAIFLVSYYSEFGVNIFIV